MFREIRDQLIDCRTVVFVDSQCKEFIGIRQAGAQRIKSCDDLFQTCALLPQRLRALRIVPDIRLLELALDFGQPFRLGLIVKDTSSTHQCVQ
jgi:hypothetical protein